MTRLHQNLTNDGYAGESEFSFRMAATCMEPSK
jgi:hypothetical protein